MATHPVETDNASGGGSAAASRLNQECFCIGTDVPALHEWLDADLASRGLTRPVIETHPHLFSALPVFLAREHVQAMQRVIGAVEAVIDTDAWRQAALADAPAIARYVPRALGVLGSYDFHLGPAGPKLIEINTNAGGAMLNAVLGRAQRACCAEVRDLDLGANDTPAIEEALFQMFVDEWRRARGTANLERIAIVDADPSAQYLYPEFLLFARLFEANGVAAVIAAPHELTLRDGKLEHASGTIDLVYNRLTDFYFEDPANATLRRAYETESAVITPHPHAHALYANKRNLAMLTDAKLLGRWGVPESTIAELAAGIPPTVIVAPVDAERLWDDRKRLFFKPARGYGAKGSYRGEKLTRKTFAEILQGDYVAQGLVPPSERSTADGSAVAVLKVDLRNYVYGGRVIAVAARLYQGQTTNFRTPGGGFAPVFHPNASGSCGALGNCAVQEEEGHGGV